MRNSVHDNPSLLDLLRCPVCRKGSLSKIDTELICRTCSDSFPLAGCRPILLRNDNQLFSKDNYKLTVPDNNFDSGGFVRFVPSPSVNLASDRVLRVLRSRLDEKGTCTILVVGGGRQRAWLDPLMCENKPHRLVYSDIDAGADVDLFCDAHDLPFIDASFDAVVTTAVLEHVLSPERVTAEIFRVLKTSGLLYSEMPFMQQVHEGAYDFTRYTLSGHRRLLNQFAEIDVGMVAGPATALVWALENFFLAFSVHPLARKSAKVIVRLGFGWVKYFDYFFANRPEAMDGASCTYFLGAKAQDCVPDCEIVAKYVGAKALRHV